MSFVHLHTHSEFSILDGTASLGKLAERAAALEMEALALTDSGNMYGAVGFSNACKKAGIQPIFGAELHLQPEGIDHIDSAREEGGAQLIALVQNDEGYQNLCAIVTHGIFEGMQYKPRVDFEVLEQHSAGLIFLTGGLKGLLGRTLTRFDEAHAIEQLGRLAKLAGPDRLFLELQDHGLPGQSELNEVTRRLSQKMGLATVATNAVHYLNATDSPVHELLNAIGSGCSVRDPRRLIAPTDQAWLKSEAEMRELFPNDLEAVERSAEIAARCEFEFEFGNYHFPATTPPDTIEDGDQLDSDANWAYFYRSLSAAVGLGARVMGEGEVPPKPEGAGTDRWVLHVVRELPALPGSAAACRFRRKNTPNTEVEARP